MEYDKLIRLITGDTSSVSEREKDIVELIDRAKLKSLSLTLKALGEAVKLSEQGRWEKIGSLLREHMDVDEVMPIYMKIDSIDVIENKKYDEIIPTIEKHLKKIAKQRKEYLVANSDEGTTIITLEDEKHTDEATVRFTSYIPVVEKKDDREIPMVVVLKGWITMGEHI